MRFYVATPPPLSMKKDRDKKFPANASGFPGNITRDGANRFKSLEQYLEFEDSSFIANPCQETMSIYIISFDRRGESCKKMIWEKLIHIDCYYL